MMRREMIRTAIAVMVERYLTAPERVRHRRQWREASTWDWRSPITRNWSLWLATRPYYCPSVSVLPRRSATLH